MSLPRTICMSLPAIVLLAVVSCSQRQQPITDIEATLFTFAEAFRSGDIETVSAHIAKDYVHVNSGSAPYDRTQWLGWYADFAAEIKDGEHIFEQYDVQSLVITKHDDAAYVTGVVRADGMRFDEGFTQTIRFTNLWIVENGQWKRAGFHDVASNE